MSLPDFLNRVTIEHGGEIHVVDLSPHWHFFNGKNPKTGEIDTLLAVPATTFDLNTADPQYVLFRYSGKNKSWSEASGRYKLADIKQYTSVPNSWIVKPFFTTTNDLIPVSKPINKEGERVMNLSKIFGRFGKAPKSEFAMSIGGGIAIKRTSGGYACLIDGKLTDIDSFAVDIDAFFFLPTTPDKLVANDVVVTGTDGAVGYVVSVCDEGGIKVYDVNSETYKVVRPASHFLMKQPFVTKVFSLLSADGGLGGMGMMLALGGLGGDGKDKGGLSEMMLIMALSGGNMFGGGGNAVPGMAGMNPMLLYFLMKDGGMVMGGGSDMLPLMMLMNNGTLGGAFGGLFGGSSAPAGECGCKHKHQKPDEPAPKV